MAPEQVVPREVVVEHVGNLEFATAGWLEMFDHFECIRAQEVDADGDRIALGHFRLLLEAHQLAGGVELGNTKALGVGDPAEQRPGARSARLERGGDVGQRLALQDVVAEHDAEAVVTHEIARQANGMGDAQRATLVAIREVQVEVPSVRQQFDDVAHAPATQDDHHLVDAHAAQGLEREVDHRPVVDRHQVLVGYQRQRMQSRPGAASQQDAFHARQSTESIRCPACQLDDEQPRYSAVVVNFRRYDLLVTCVDSLTASSSPPAEIIVVDNESDASGLAEFTARYPAAQVIANKTNTGFAFACNQGWRASSAPFVLFMNPDVTVEQGCLRECLAEIGSAADIGALTCRLVLPDGRLDHACHRGIPTPSASLAYKLRLNRLFPRSRLFGRYTMSWLDPLTVHDVEACCGAFMLVRRSVLETVGGWDEHYWFYGEDLDLCVRIGGLGKRIRYLGTSTAVHLKGASSHLRERTRDLGPRDRATKRKVQAAIIDSHTRFFRQHFERSTPWLIGALIRASFAAQRVRLKIALRLDSIRGL